MMDRLAYRQEMQPLVLGEFFNRVAEHSAWHSGCVLFQPAFKTSRIPFTGLAQQPAYSLLKQIVQRRAGRLQENIRYRIRVVELSGADKSHCAYNTDTALPNRFPVSGQIVEQGPVFIQEPLPQQRIAAQIHQVPIVDVLKVRKIKVYTFLPALQVAP